MTPYRVNEILGAYNGTARFTEIRRLTEEILHELYIEDIPIRIDKIVADYGLEIYRFDLNEFKVPEGSNEVYGGVAGLISLGQKSIVVNSGDSSNRQIFTVAHEFGHFIMHRDKLEENPNTGVLFRRPLGEANTDPIEAEANYFAGSLLVPRRFLNRLDNYPVSDLAKLFAVSEEVIRYRLSSERTRVA